MTESGSDRIMMLTGDPRRDAELLARRAAYLEEQESLAWDIREQGFPVRELSELRGLTNIGSVAAQRPCSERAGRPRARRQVRRRARRIIRTYFIPDPRVHGHPTNFEYFLNQ